MHRVSIARKAAGEIADVVLAAAPGRQYAFITERDIHAAPRELLLFHVVRALRDRNLEPVTECPDYILFFRL